MKINDVVAIQWVDSGLELHGSHADAQKIKLKTAWSYGRVVRVDKEAVVIVHDDGGEDDERCTFGMIWRKSIIKVLKLEVS